MTGSDHAEIQSSEGIKTDFPQQPEHDNMTAVSSEHKSRKTREKNQTAEGVELRLRAVQTEFQRVEAERNQLEKRRKSVHASYCMVLALMFLAALLIVPKLQRNSYLKGYDEGVRQASQSQDRQQNETPPTKQTNPAPVKQADSAPTRLPEQTEQTMPASERITEAVSEAETEPAATIYIGNKNSKKFHLPTCSSLPAEKNQIFFESREEAIENGYSPCGSCNP